MIFIPFIFAVHSLPWLFQSKTRLALSPAKIISLVSGVMTVPFLSIVYFYPENSYLYFQFSHRRFIYLLDYFSVLLIVSSLTTFIGVFIGGKIKIVFKKNMRERVYYPRKIRMLAYFTFTSTFVLIVLKLQAAGGLLNLLASLHLRSFLLAGTGHYDIAIIPGANLAIFLLIFARSIDGKPSIFFISVAIIVLALSLAVFGGRKTPILLIITAILIASVYNKNLRLYSPKLFLAYTLIISIFVGLLLVRLSSQSGESQIDFSMIEIIANMSYVDTYIFIIHHFSENSFWNWATLPELIFRFVPFLYPEGRPPLDDGVYVRSLMEGVHARPGMSYKYLFQSSLPPETIGFGFMNYGILGVIFTSFIKGFVSGFVFRVSKNNNYEPISLFFAIYIAISFHFTNLRIFQSLILYFGLLIFSGVMRSVYRYRSHRTH